MALTKYQYSLANDFADGLNSDNLRNTIQSEEITIALDRIETNGDEVGIWFKDELPSGQVDLLNTIVAAHDSTPVDKITRVAVTAIEDPISLTKNNEIHSAPPKGESPIIVTHNFCDPKTWYTDSQKVTKGLLNVDTAGKVYSFPSEHDIIDVETGRTSKAAKLYDKTIYHPFQPATWRPIYLPRVYVNDVLKDESTYKINYVNGTGPNNRDYIEFKDGHEISSDSIVTATYYYARTAVFRLIPSPGKIIKIKMVELQFSQNLAIHNRAIKFLVFAPNPAAGYALQQYGPGEIYRSVINYEDESNNDRTNILPPVGNLKIPRVIWIWDYQTLTELRSSYQMEVRIVLEDIATGALDKPINVMSTEEGTWGQDTNIIGEYASATFHTIVENE